jgi:hypothetical protein
LGGRTMDEYFSKPDWFRIWDGLLVSDFCS